MKPWPFLVLGLLALLPSACQKGKFSEDKTAGETYEIKVVDLSGDATAADGTITATVEGPDGDVDSKDSGSAGNGTDTADSKGGTGTGADTADSKGGTGTGDDPDQGGGTPGGGAPGKSAGKGADKGNGKGSGKGGDAEAGDCAAVAGINKDRVKVSGSLKSLTMTPGDAFALKITGNQNKVHLKMSADSAGARVSAICIFAAGNQAQVTMDIGVTVGKIFVKARGNKALIEGSVTRDGVIENLQVDANGNQPSIVMKGEGTYPCDQATVTCERP